MGKANQESETHEHDKFTGNREIDDLLIEARKYYATAFPNTARQGCPARQELISIVEAHKLPSTEIRRHILACSDCFRDFQAIRQIQTGNSKAFAPSNEIKKSGFRFFFYPLAAGFAGAALLLVFAFAFFVWYSADEKTVADNQKFSVVNPPPGGEVAEDVNRSNPPPEPATTAAADDYPAKQKIDKAEPKGNLTDNQKDDIKTAAPKPIAQDTVRIDIKPRPVWRDEQTNLPDDKPIKVFKARRIRLQLNIPLEYPAGAYEISFYNESGKKITAQSVARERGEKLQANFNLSAFRGQRLRLCVAPKGEVPDCFPVKIVGVR